VSDYTGVLWLTSIAVEVCSLSSRILFLPLCDPAQSDCFFSTETLEAVLLDSGHDVVRLEREWVSDELLDNSDAVFLEVIRDDELAFIKELRAKTRKPVLVYGHDVPKSMQIESLGAGADAFLRIPDSLDVLQARVHAFLRRSGLESFRGDALEGEKIR